ncbi:MAG TPA: GlsB/YeaQ/YmgE family stress response membrane protein [Polyangiaceae bacterium]|nr:GlsB/YeaQ/YmgE family stress response membrane protein [Polyangiaceae bacterium]
MTLILFLVFGLVVGFVARAIMPGNQKMGLLATMLLGILGSFIGGFIAALVTRTRVLDFNTAGLTGSIVGALIVLALAGGIFSRRGGLST